MLDATEFSDLLKKSGFNFSDETIDKIMSQADTNGDNMIQYEEFVPAIKDLLASKSFEFCPADPEPVEAPQVVDAAQNTVSALLSGGVVWEELGADKPVVRSSGYNKSSWKRALAGEVR